MKKVKNVHNNFIELGDEKSTFGDEKSIFGDEKSIFGDKKSNFGDEKSNLKQGHKFGSAPKM